MNQRRLVAVILLAILWEGCGLATRVVHERTLNAEEVIRRVREREEKIQTVRGSGKITIESPESSGSGSFAAQVRKPDSAKVDLTGPFGIRIGTLALSRQEVVFFDWRSNTATIGVPDEQTLQSMLRIKLRFEEILHAFTGEFLSFASGDSLKTFAVEEGVYVLRFASGESTREFRIDGDSFIVSSYRLLASDSTATLVAMASRTDEIAGIAVPTLLRVIMPKERRSLTVAYGDLRINEDVRCTFDIPKEANIVRR